MYSIKSIFRMVLKAINPVSPFPSPNGYISKYAYLFRFATRVRQADDLKGPLRIADGKQAAQALRGILCRKRGFYDDDRHWTILNRHTALLCYQHRSA